MAPPPFSSTPPLSQVLDHTSSVPPPPSLYRTSLPTVPRTNNMSTSEQQSTSAANVPALKSTKSTQAGFPFLSLPPEIRNMVYHHIFAPVKNGTCWTILTNWQGNRLRRLRCICSLCRSDLTHTTCRPEYPSVRDMHFTFQLSGNATHSGILQTCNTIMNEALPISLAGIHIGIVCHNFRPMRPLRDLEALKVFLIAMRQPKGAYLSVFTCTYCHLRPSNGDDMGQISQIINGAGIRIGCLILRGTTRTDPNMGKCFVTNLDRLENKPAKVEWTQSCGRRSPQYETERRDFNEAAKKWLAELAKVKAADPDARLPLLRDFLPQFFEDSG